MVMQRYALVDASGVVENVVMWDGGEDWAPPQGFTAVQSDTAAIGSSYVNGVFSEPAPQAIVLTLAQAQAAQISVVNAAYASAVVQPVSYSSKGGATKTFQADSLSQATLMQATQGYNLAGAVPNGFYWVSADNAQVPFTLADLSGLYEAMLAQGWEAFQKKQSLKAKIQAAGTVDEVQAISW